MYFIQYVIFSFKIIYFWYNKNIQGDGTMSEELIKSLIMWGPTLLMVLSLLFYFLVGIIRGLRKNKKSFPAGKGFFFYKALSHFSFDF